MFRHAEWVEVFSTWNIKAKNSRLEKTDTILYVSWTIIELHQHQWPQSCLTNDQYHSAPSTNLLFCTARPVSVRPVSQVEWIIKLKPIQLTLFSSRLMYSRTLGGRRSFDLLLRKCLLPLKPEREFLWGVYISLHPWKQCQSPSSPPLWAPGLLLSLGYSIKPAHMSIILLRVPRALMLWENNIRLACSCIWLEAEFYLWDKIQKFCCYDPHILTY